jgi:hypothetical protein
MQGNHERPPTTGPSILSLFWQRTGPERSTGRWAERVRRRHSPPHNASEQLLC